MKDYTGYYEAINEKILSNADLMFEKQLLTCEARDILIDGQAERAILRNNNNEMSEKVEERLLYIKLDTIAKLGSKVIVEEKPGTQDEFLVVTELDYHYSYLKAKIRKINYTLKFWTPYGKLVEERCLLDRDALLSIGIQDSAQAPFPINSSKLRAVLQYNDDTKHLNKDTRFIANKTAYKIIAMDMNEKGLISIVAEETQVKEGLDDMINQVPFNPYNEVMIEPDIYNIFMKPNKYMSIKSRILQDNKEMDGQILYTSSDETVARIDSLGNLKSVGEGETLITLTLKENTNVKVKIICEVSRSEVSDTTYEIVSNNGFEIRETTTVTFAPKAYYNTKEIESNWIFDIDYVDMNTSYVDIKEKTSKYIKIKALNSKGKFILRAQNESDSQIIEKTILLKGVWE